MVADKDIFKKASVLMVTENKCGCKKNKNINIRTKFYILNARFMEVSAKYDIGVDEVIKKWNIHCNMQYMQ